MAYGSLLADVVQSSATGSPPQFNDTTGTQIGTLCRAWVNFNGSTPPVIRASFNISSITRNGLGDFTLNFTSAFTDANYAVVGVGGGNIAGPTMNVPNAGTPTQTTTAVRIGISSTSLYYDPSYVQLAIFR